MKIGQIDGKELQKIGWSRAVIDWVGRIVTELNRAQINIASLQVIGQSLQSITADGAVLGWVTNTPKTIDSLSIPTGTWLVFGDGMFGGSGITGTGTLLQLSTIAGAFETISGQALSAFETPLVPLGGANIRAALAPRLITSTVTAPAIANVVGRIIFTAGTPNAGASIRAVRIE